ncbi:MAG: protein kinase [Planctomycetes bacterium]|nr:protein kinase [Planctomycetota bacterium]
MLLNPAARELIIKVVYYGPAFAGKSTNLACLQHWAPAGSASELQYQDMHSERTLGFERLADEFGAVQGHRLRIAYHTVPGQNYYAATRKLLLAGADGIVFVADSRREALDENVAAMNEMLEHLRALGQSEQTPVVLQYNKQDLPTALRPEQLDPLFNVRGWPARAACAIQGQGVAECAQDLLQRLVAIAQATPLAALQAAPRPRSWLLSCHRCQTMLEVAEASVGALFTCGACGARVEVVDPDRGLTRAPLRGPLASVAAPPPSGATAATPTPTPSPSLPAPATAPTAPPPRSAPSPAAAPEEHDPVELAAWSPQGGEWSDSALQPSASAVPAPAAAEADDAAPLPGWETLGLIDRGPHGRRWRMRDPGDGRRYRVLVLARELVAEPGYLDRLNPFVDLAGPLKHPHILSLRELRVEDDRIAFISRDPPDHEALTTVLARRRVLAPPHAMDILRQIALALEEAARAGVVHGWLRPDCILLSPDGSVLVDEFAVPKSHRFLVRESAGASAATEYYLAPEYLQDDAVIDLHSDMFLCGALLYRMITGDGLVTGYNAHEALHRLLANGPKPLRSVNNSVSRELDAFYRRLVAVDRAARFASYRELLEALERFGGGAKRQALSLTQPQAAARATGGTGYYTSPTRPVVRSAPAAPRPPPAAPPPPPAARPAARPAPRRRSSWGAWFVIMLLLAVIAGLGYLVAQRSPASGSAASTPPPAVAASPAPAPTAPASASAASAAPAAPTLPPSPLRPPPPAATSPEQAAQELINTLLAAERYRSALEAAERHGLRERVAEVYSRHGQRRQQIAAAVAVMSDLQAVRQLLQPALDGTWGMNDDQAWAQGLLQQATARLQPLPPPAAATAASEKTEKAPEEPKAAPSAPAAAPPPPAPGSPTTSEPALGQARGVLAAIARYDLAGAQAALAALPPGSAELPALRLALSALDQRIALLERVGKARTTKLRLQHPTIPETVDVVGAQAQGLVTATATGGTSLVPWHQVSAREVGRLLAEAAAAPGANPADHTAAIAFLSAGGDPAFATVHLRRFRQALEAERAAALEALIALARQLEALDLLARAEEALRSGNQRALQECLAELRKPERAALPPVAAALPRLEAAKAASGETRAPGALADRVAFDSPVELQQFPEQSGTWQVAGGVASHVRAAQLGRRDTGAARSVQAIITPLARRGTLTIQFRGLSLLCQLEQGQLTTTIGERSLPSRSIAIAERMPLIIYIALDPARRQASVEINGMVVEDAPFESVSEGFLLAVSEDASIQIDEIAFTRHEGDAARQALRALGWEAEGPIALEQQTLRLVGSATTPAAISAAVATNAIGYDLTCKGEGGLRIALEHGKERQALEVRLNPGRTYRLAVRWLGGEFLISDAASGAVLAKERLAVKPVTITIVASSPCTIQLPIRPVRQ